MGAVFLLAFATFMPQLVPSVAALSAITSAGPLTRVEITPDLNCAVDHVGDSQPEFFGDTACATLVAAGGTLYGPALIPAGSSAAPRTTFTLVSQSGVTGSGTASDPYTIVTVVDLGGSGLRITETDSYVVGLETYRTDVALANTGSSPVDAIIYRAGDCFLQDSDLGFGSVDLASGAVACVNGVDDGMGGVIPGSRIEQWYPLSSGSSYYEAFYNSVWAAIGTQTAFPNTCDCATYEDNGAGLSWTATVPAGGSITRSHLTNFSPLGRVPLSTTKTADSATAAPGGTDGYTITIDNPNAEMVSLSSISDTLPAGFSYISGTTTGATTSDPSVMSQTLTWTGPFSVPAAGNLTLAFDVTVSSTPGTYYNEATAVASDGFAVAATGPTAPITVDMGPGNTPPTVLAGGPYGGTEGAAFNIDGTVTDPDAGDMLTTTWTYAPGVGVDAGATCSFGDASAVDTTATCTDDGTFVLTLSANDGVNPGVMATADLNLGNADPSVHISAPADISTYNVGATINLAASVMDPGANDTHTCSIDWGDGMVELGMVAAGTCSGSHSYAGVGVFTIVVVVTDDNGGTGSDEIMLTITDQSVKVTGGGFIVNGGRTSFGFVVQDDHDGLRGQLQVRAPGHNRFHGDQVAALATSSTTATWWGSGRWNNQDGYTFEVTVVDNGRGHKKSGTPDHFSITIRDASNVVVFAASGPLKGGNITIH